MLRLAVISLVLLTLFPRLAIGEPQGGPAVSYTLSFGYDRAGRVDEIGDASGARSLGYDKGHLVSAVYTSGLLKGYEIIRHRDPTGRDTGFTLYRDGADILSADLELAAGLGLRLDLPIGPVRFEYGYNLTRDPGEPAGAFHFAIGTTF